LLLFKFWKPNDADARGDAERERGLYLGVV